jgi:hypothetical protein
MEGTLHRYNQVFLTDQRIHERFSSELNSFIILAIVVDIFVIFVTIIIISSSSSSL